MKPWLAKWLINCYPPLLIHRIAVRKVSKDYRSVQVRVRKSVLNRNLNGSIFGGTIFSSADPFHALMYWQHLKQEGIETEVWLKQAQIRYLQPARTSLLLEFALSDADLHDVKQQLIQYGKAERHHSTEINDSHGSLVAVVESIIYLRKKS